MAVPDVQSIDPESSDDGVELSLIRWMLSLPPPARLQFLPRRINALLAIRELNAGN